MNIFHSCITTVIITKMIFFRFCNLYSSTVIYYFSHPFKLSLLSIFYALNHYKLDAQIIKLPPENSAQFCVHSFPFFVSAMAANPSRRALLVTLECGFWSAFPSTFHSFFRGQIALFNTLAKLRSKTSLAIPKDLP